MRVQYNNIWPYVHYFLRSFVFPASRRVSLSNVGSILSVDWNGACIFSFRLSTAWCIDYCELRKACSSRG